MKKSSFSNMIKIREESDGVVYEDSEALEKDERNSHSRIRTNGMSIYYSIKNRAIDISIGTMGDSEKIKELLLKDTEVIADKYKTDNKTYYYRIKFLNNGDKNLSIKDLLSDVKNPQLFYRATDSTISIVSRMSNRDNILKQWIFDANGVCYSYWEVNDEGKINKVGVISADEYVANDGDVECTFRNGKFKYKCGKYTIDVDVTDKTKFNIYLMANNEVKYKFTYKPAFDDEDTYIKFFERCSDGSTALISILSAFCRDFKEYLAKGDSMFADRPTYQMVLDKVKKIAKPIEEMNDMNFSTNKRKPKLTFWF